MDFLEIKELLDLHTIAINAKTQFGNDMLSFKIDEVIKHQKVQNGRMDCLEKDTKFARLIQEYPKISILIFIFVVVFVGGFGITEIIQIIKSIF